MSGARPDDVAVVVVTWNSAAVLERCLGSALAEHPAELVVVDNGSTDATVALARAVAPTARVITHATNLGFAAGCNAGLRATSAPLVLLLNDDAILEPGYLSVLCAALTREPRAASAVGKLLTGRGGRAVIDSAGIVLRRWALTPLDRGHGELDRGQYETAGEIFGPSAAAALYRRKALAELGDAPLDEELFAYYEDVDLAWRLRRRGWIHLYDPSAVARHLRRGPDGKPTSIAARAFANRYLVWLRNESALRFASYAPLALGWEAARLARRALRDPRLLTGLPRAVRLAPAALAKRRSP